MPLPLGRPHGTCIPSPSTDCPTPAPCKSGPLPASGPSPQPARGGGGEGSPPAHPPWLWPHSPKLAGPSGHWGGWGWERGEALKAGDCLGELGDRAPIVPYPEAPQWSSGAQRGFDNGQDISIQSQPLGPLPVPQPRGGGWGDAGLAGGGRGWGRAETYKRSQSPGAPLGTLPRRQGRETRPGPPNLPRAKKGFPNGKYQGDWEGWGRRGCGRPGPFLPTGLWKEARGQPDSTHLGPQFSHLF